ncbi:MAG: hypothetical protein O9253_02280 [Aquidulcibacter sp.]|jgi:hypothetical protein|nr:hypothetical protein [Aquidulcibacter sp.]
MNPLSRIKAQYQRRHNVDLETLNPHTRLRLAYIPELPEGWSPTEFESRHIDVTSGIDNMVPDDPFVALFNLVGYSLKNWRTHCLNQYGVDVANRQPSPYCSTRTAAENRDQWAKALKQPQKIITRNSGAISYTELYHAVENANYGGTPCVIFETDLHTLLNHDFNRDSHITPASSLINARGGLIGWHNWSNGSGHLSLLSNPLHLPANVHAWHYADYHDFGPSDIYGFVSEAFVTCWKNLQQRELILASQID